jgi:hypothetical protein
MFLGSKVRPVRRADNLTTFCEHNCQAIYERCLYVCMYAYMHICIYVCMYVRIPVYM